MKKVKLKRRTQPQCHRQHLKYLFEPRSPVEPNIKALYADYLDTQIDRPGLVKAVWKTQHGHCDIFNCVVPQLRRYLYD